MIQKRIWILAITLIFCPWSFAFSATVTANFTVTATVVKTCTVSATTLPFGNYVLSQVNATSTITVQCTKATPFDIGLNPGTAPSATVTTRAMTSGGNTLPYNLYQDAAHTTNWGQTVGTDTLHVASASGNQDAYTVYGVIPANEGTAPVGSYTDTITVTVTY